MVMKGGSAMSDFQSFLDRRLSKVDISQFGKDTETFQDYDIYKEIQVQVSKARKDAGLTQRQLSNKSGLSQANISNIENGTTHPTIDTLKKIADATGKRLHIEFTDREGLI